MRSFARSSCLVLLGILIAVPVGVFSAMTWERSQDSEPAVAEVMLAETLSRRFDDLIRRLRSGVAPSSSQAALVEAFYQGVRPGMTTTTMVRMIPRDGESDTVGFLPLLFIETDALATKYARIDNGLPLQFVGNGFLYYPSRAWSKEYFTPVAVRELMYWQMMDQDTEEVDVVDVTAYATELSTLDYLVGGRLLQAVHIALTMPDIRVLSDAPLRSPGAQGMEVILRAWPGQPASEDESRERVKLTIAALVFVQLERTEDRILALRTLDKSVE
jgi:hypothetical protein